VAELDGKGEEQKRPTRKKNMTENLAWDYAIPRNQGKRKDLQLVNAWTEMGLNLKKQRRTFVRKGVCKFGADRDWTDRAAWDHISAIKE